MTTHGSSGTGRWTYGSVAEKVLLGASSPILLVHPD
jgi:nucleotide-binding universal stress UspA family protein